MNASLTTPSTNSPTLTIGRKYLHIKRTVRGTAKMRGAPNSAIEVKPFGPKPLLPTPAKKVVEARQPMRKKVVRIKTGKYFTTIFSLGRRERPSNLSSFPKVRRFSAPPLAMVRKELHRELYETTSSVLGVRKRLKKTIAIWNVDSYWPSLQLCGGRFKV